MLQRIKLVGHCVFTLYLLILLLHAGHTMAQERLTYHLTNNNGLPSNYTYAMLTDRLGYLWVSTEKGVVKYNGYTCKLFTTAEGLPVDDIWGLLEDRKGRIWLATRSNEIGYIYNDRYHKTYLKGIKGSIFPYKMNHFDSNIIFCSGHINNRPLQTICLEQNDTIYPLPLSTTMLNTGFDSLGMPGVFMNKHKQVLFSGERKVLILSDLEKAIYDPGKLKIRQLPDTLFKFTQKYGGGLVYLKNFTISTKQHKQSNMLLTYNVATQMIDSIDLGVFGVHEPITFVSYDISSSAIGRMFVFTTNHAVIFRVDDKIRYLTTYDLRNILNNWEGKKNVIGLVNNRLWGLGCATVKHGVYLAQEHKNVFKPVPGLDLTEYTYSGTVDDTITTWWSSELKTFIMVAGHKIIKRVPILNTVFIGKAIKYSRDTLLLSGTYTYFYEPKADRTTEFNFRWVANFRGFHIEAPKSWILSALTGIFRLEGEPGSFKPTQVDADRYNDLIYDTIRNTCWAYNTDKILLYNGREKQVFTGLLPKESGKIETIKIDNKYGTVFIKTSTSLYIYDPEKNIIKELNYNINLRKASIVLHHSMLIVYGEFGILFANIKGKGVISKPVIYHNLKKTYYSKCQAHAITGNKIMLITDRETYEVDIPAPEEVDEAAKNSTELPKRLTMLYGGIITPLNKNDTIRIDQVNRVFQLDIINAAGSGNITYAYLPQGDTTWLKSGEGEMIVPHSFKPDKYYTISITCMDDAWKSDVMVFTIYIQPYWWQTRTAKSAFWVGGILLGTLIIIGIILITRKLVTRANEKKHAQMELELKAIYAQINPHFIFNTLTSALLLVSKNKMDEAYAHISKFSRLLRSYLKSSRNTYISIEEEIDNLNNYTELQQTRFKDRFSANIVIDPDLKGKGLKIPSLLIQPFVENAINHGLLRNDKAGILDIAFSYTKDRNEVICTITDNGIGREQARENKKTAERTLDSYGNLMIKDLVTIFNKYEDMNINIEYEDKQAPETGTVVTITISNPHNIQKNLQENLNE